MEMIIKKIEEAYSMQPRTWTICQKTHEHNDDCIVQIILSRIELGQYIEDCFMAYCGYNKNNEKLFQVKADSVNVEYMRN